MATTTEKKEALSDAKIVWNTISVLFNAVSKQLVTIPDLSSVVGVFQAVADTAGNHIQTLRDAITAVGGLEATHTTTEQQDQAKALGNQLTALLQHFEETTGLQVGGIVVDRTDKVSVGDVVIVE